MKKRIGILTFFAAHNCGAVMQAYALQNIIKNMGYDAQIINVVKKSQEEFYHLYTHRNGWKSYLKNILLLPFHFSRKRKEKKFFEFINFELKISGDRYDETTDLTFLSEQYDGFVAGSDQIWNSLKKPDFMTSYMLDFVENGKLKVAYAPSLGIAKEEEIMPYQQLLCDFDSLSCRELNGTEIISKITSKKVLTVLDPTLLLERKYFERLLTDKRIADRPYLFYYSLDGFQNRNRNLQLLRRLAEKFSLQLVIYMPESPRYLKGAICLNDAGPKEWLTAIREARLVCTNSFHGTALSVQFEKPFYVLEQYDGKDDRKSSVLKQLGIEERMISNTEQIDKIENYTMNYDAVNCKLKELRAVSKKYLEDAFLNL